MKSLLNLSFLAGCLSFISCTQNGKDAAAQTSSDSDKASAHRFTIVKSEEEWKKVLTPEQYSVLRQGGTERACSGAFWNSHSEGMYYCAGCDNPLFVSKVKFESGTGWPSFFQPVSDTSVIQQPDTSYGMVRTEVLCYRCGGHLGHVFDDAPGTPTGMRFCMNSVAMAFRESK